MKNTLISLKKVLPLLVVAILFSGCESADPESADSSEADRFTIHEVVAEDAAWCWFSDPRAAYHRGESEKAYFGFINMQGDVVIGSRDLVDNSQDTFVLHEELQVDDHNNPSILFMPDGRLLVFYSEHNGHVFMRKSVRPEDITEWEPERIISEGPERYTYTMPVMLSEEDNRIYIFGRKVGPAPNFTDWWQYVKYSDDLGETWSEEQIYLDNQGRDNPPYLKLISDNRSRIDFLFTDGHPKIGSDVSTYHMYYEEGSFFQTGGDRITDFGNLPVVINDVDPVYSAKESNIRSWIWDIVLDENRNPVVTYARYPHETDHRYHYAYWDGDMWIDEEVSRAGSWMPALRQGDVIREAHYSGGIVLDSNDPRRVYLSRQIHGRFEIEQKYLRENGQWESSFITRDSEVDNVRPYVVYNGSSDSSLLFWMRGFYNHYTNWDTELIMGH